jgi:hypothetical protein
LVLQRGALTVQGAGMATALHRSLREYIRENALAARRQRNAVVVTPGAGEDFTVSVAPNIRAAFADREKNKSPAA